MDKIIDEKKLATDGAYGSIYSAYDSKNKREVALKKVPIIDEELTDNLLREGAYLREMRHDNIIRLHQVFVQKDKIVYVMDYVPTTLTNFMKKPRCDSSQVRGFLKQLLKDVAYIHEHKMVHRDIKPDNILIDMSTKVPILKLADFGMARVHLTNTLTPEVGTFGYRAPEILFQFPDYDEAVDIWAVGCVFAEMSNNGDPLFNTELCWLYDGELKFDYRHNELVMIFRLLGRPDENMWSRLEKVNLNDFEPHIAKDLEEMFPNLDDQGVDLLLKMLCINPNQRITAQDALDHPFLQDP